MTLHSAPSLKFSPPDEKEVQAGIITLFRHAGVECASTSQYRASRIAIGFPDLVCFVRARRTMFFFEVKTYETTWTGPAGPVRFTPYDRATWKPKPLAPAQQAFRDRALACGVLHFFGGLPAAEDALIQLTLGRRRPSGVFEYDVRRVG